MRILFVGDVFGVPGRRALEDRLPGLREELDVDFCIVNGENAADGAGITDFIVNNRVYGRRIDIEPSAAPSIVVSITHLRPDSSLTVGSSVAARTSRIGTLIDLSRVEKQALARYTNDAGNHVSVEAHSSVSVSLP